MRGSGSTGLSHASKSLESNNFQKLGVCPLDRRSKFETEISSFYKLSSWSFSKESSFVSVASLLPLLLLLLRRLLFLKSSLVYSMLHVSTATASFQLLSPPESQHPRAPFSKHPPPELLFICAAHISHPITCQALRHVTQSPSQPRMASPPFIGATVSICSAWPSTTARS